MDYNYYSDKTISQFVLKKLCQNDKLLYTYYLSGQSKKFRKRFASIKGSADDVHDLVVSLVTDNVRDIILTVINDLTLTMRPFGDIIISGGEAFNMYFEKPDRLVTSDIDTKFVPVFKLKSGKIVGVKNPRYFEYLQLAKLFLWNNMGMIAEKINTRVFARLKKLNASKIGKILGLAPPSKGPYVTRRYSLIPKKRHAVSTNAVSTKDILIDVEVFALDTSIRYFSFKKGRVIEHPVGGMLDVAVMRPYEFGYDVAYERKRGHPYTDRTTGKQKSGEHIMFAGARFLVDDLYIMKHMGLRPGKTAKDRTRLIEFSKKILGIKGISSANSDEVIHAKALKSPSLAKSPRMDIRRRPAMTPRDIQRARNVNPMNYLKYTSLRWKPVVIERLGIGVRAPRNLVIKNFQKTSGIYRFNTKTYKWTLDNSDTYIKNEFTHRPVLGKYKKIPDVHNARNILYGYNPVRNKNMSPNLIKKSALLPLVGLKNMSFLHLK